MENIEYVLYLDQSGGLLSFRGVFKEIFVLYLISIE